MARNRGGCSWPRRGAIADAHSSLPFGERVAVLAEESDGALHTYLDITLPQKGLSADLPPTSDGPAVFGLLTHPTLLDIAEAALGCGELLSNPTQHIRITTTLSNLTLPAIYIHHLHCYPYSRL